MEESEGSGFDDFSVEMEDFEYVQVKKFDRIFNLGEGGSFTQMPLVRDGRVYVGCLDRNVYCIDARTGSLIWRFEAEGGFGPASPVWNDGLLFIGSHDQNMYCLDAATGRPVWKFRTQGMLAASAEVAEGRLYFGSRDHNVYCLESKTGRLIWKFRTYGEIGGTPTFHEGKLFVGSYDHFLYCIDALDGSLIWKFETQGDIYNLPRLLVHGGNVYFPSFDNYLRVLEIKTGKLVWKFLTGHYGGMGTGPVLHKDTLYQSNREGIIYALTLDGKELWNFRINNAMAYPAVEGDRIYFGTEEQNLYCISLHGKLLWKFQTQGILWWRPTICSGMVYFTSWDCHLYCVDAETHQLAWKFRGQGAPSYVPPPFDSFELSVKKRVEDSGFEEKGSGKRYSTDLGEDEEGKFYKSRITYRVSTQYSAKGKYQKDSDEEAL